VVLWDLIKYLPKFPLEVVCLYHCFYLQLGEYAFRTKTLYQWPLSINIWHPITNNLYSLNCWYNIYLCAKNICDSLSTSLHLVKPLIVFGVEGYSFPLPEKCLLIQCHQVNYCTSYKSNLLVTLIIMTKTMMIMTLQHKY